MHAMECDCVEAFDELGAPRGVLLSLAAAAEAVLEQLPALARRGLRRLRGGLEVPDGPGRRSGPTRLPPRGAGSMYHGQPGFAGAR